MTWPKQDRHLSVYFDRDQVWWLSSFFLSWADTCRCGPRIGCWLRCWRVLLPLVTWESEQQGVTVQWCLGSCWPALGALVRLGPIEGWCICGWCVLRVCRLLEGIVERVLLRIEPLLCEYYSWCAILPGAASGFVDGAHVTWV